MPKGGYICGQARVVFLLLVLYQHARVDTIFGISENVCWGREMFHPADELNCSPLALAMLDVAGGDYGDNS